MKNPRESFTTALHPEATQVDRRQLRAEVSFSCRQNLKLRAMDGRLIGAEIGKTEN